MLADARAYESFLQEVQERIRQARVRAALAVNRELVWLYWRSGRDILARQRELGWGAGVIDRLAADLHREFPDMRGFSARNLKYMRAFAEAYPEEPFVQQVVAQIPWGHNVRILDRVQDRSERESNTPCAASRNRSAFPPTNSPGPCHKGLSAACRPSSSSRLSWPLISALTIRLCRASATRS